MDLADNNSLNFSFFDLAILLQRQPWKIIDNWVITLVKELSKVLPKLIGAHGGGDEADPKASLSAVKLLGPVPFKSSRAF